MNRSVLIHAVSKLINGRTLGEALLKLEECKCCEHFSHYSCKQVNDLQYVQRLAIGTCVEWDNPQSRRFADVNDGRVKIVFTNVALLCGGAERWLVDLATGLPKDKYCVCIAIEELNATDIELLQKAKQAEFVVFTRHHEQIVCDAADIVVSWAQFLKCKAPHKVFCSHGCDHWTDALVRGNNRISDYKFTAVSEQAANPWRRISRDAISILYNGSDEERLQPTGRDIRAELHIPDETILIGFISRLIPEKNPWVVAIAAHEMRNIGYDAKAIFVGASKASQRYEDCIYVDRVENIGDYLEALDCFMLPSNSEAFSLAITEAWLAEVPVIATPVGAINELEKQFGKMVVRLGTSVTDAVLSAICEENQPIVDNAYCVAKEHFTKQSMVKRWEEYFDGLIRTA